LAETVQDATTKLEWQRAVDGTKRSQKDSLDYCAQLSLGGLSGWHLPNVSELTGIVQYDALHNGVALDPAFAGPGDLYWTSTQNEGIPTLAWALTFNLGILDGISVTGLGYARCVRHMEPVSSGSSSCGCEMPGASGRASAALWASALAAFAILRRRPRVRARNAQQH
jgi:MYXO-CTERM domain-containing protein